MALFFVFILCYSTFVFPMTGCFCCVRFTLLGIRQEIGWEEHLCNDLERVKRVKSFPSLTAHWAALISVPLALSQTPAYTAKTAGPVHRAVCPFTPRRLGRYQIILLGDRGAWV